MFDPQFHLSLVFTCHSQGVGRGAVGAQFLNGSGGKATLARLSCRDRGGQSDFRGVKCNVGNHGDKTGYNEDIISGYHGDIKACRILNHQHN